MPACLGLDIGFKQAGFGITRDGLAFDTGIIITTAAMEYTSRLCSRGQSSR